jgi:integrase
MGLSSMFNDAASMKAGRLIARNPFEKLGISRGRGRRDQQPPSEQKAWEIIECARRLSCPSFAAWLQVAAFTGLRPGELDALRWTRVDFARERIVVAEQFNAATRKFDTPKNHLQREAPLTAHARTALRRVLLRADPRRALDAERTGVPLEGRARSRGVGGEPVPRNAPLRRLVHGQRPRDALRGRRDRARAPGRRQSRPAAVRPPRQAPSA